MLGVFCEANGNLLVSSGKYPYRKTLRDTAAPCDMEVFFERRVEKVSFEGFWRGGRSVV